MRSINLALLWSDWIVWALFFIVLIGLFYFRKQAHLREPWLRVMRSKLGMCTLVILLFYAAIGLLDSIHFRVYDQQATHNSLNLQTQSALDFVLGDLAWAQEKTYSAPFARKSFTQSLMVTPSGQQVRGHVPLRHRGQSSTTTVVWQCVASVGLAVVSFLILALLLTTILAWRTRMPWGRCAKNIIHGKTLIAWRPALLTFLSVWILIFVGVSLSAHYHILGTDKVGRDVFYQALKSIRTGLLIGTLTTLFMLPFALLAGTLAGYFRGITDDIIQYLYTTLSSIPGVLLISAVILMLQVYISNHPALFPTLAQRADVRLLALCFILGITSWASLCRLLRAETLKLRHLEYVQAAQALGVKKNRIILRHILPNVMHIILITVVLDFSGLVLAEAVLSYVGIGVDPTTMSWGNMINSSRLELAREPIVWWPLVAALIFMFILVLSANLFADTVRDAFDPRLRNIQQ